MASKDIPPIEKRGYAHPEALVSTDWVAGHLDDPSVRLVESNEDVLLYDTGHVPGAVKIDWHSDLNDPLVRDYLDGERFAARMREKGISRETTVVFYGDKGRLDVGRDGCFVTEIGKSPEKIGGGADIRDNMRNFIDAVKAGDPGKLNAPITEGAISASLCHLGNISTRVGRPIAYDPPTMRCSDDADAMKLLARTYRTGYELPEV